MATGPTSPSFGNVRRTLGALSELSFFPALARGFAGLCDRVTVSTVYKGPKEGNLIIITRSAVR